MCHQCLCIIPDKTESIYYIFHQTVLYWVSKKFVPDFEKKLVGVKLVGVNTFSIITGQLKYMFTGSVQLSHN